MPCQVIRSADSTPHLASDRIGGQREKLFPERRGGREPGTGGEHRGCRHEDGRVDGEQQTVALAAAGAEQGLAGNTASLLAAQAVHSTGALLDHADSPGPSSHRSGRRAG
ncbi:hypothetical protein [Streptomyces sp. NPDC058457]|uniref:hypothetical protein n=1 Tax=Streptomyces sp. NPDC058457 TaxID=3346507 RepID=UPI00364B0AF2